MRSNRESIIDFALSSTGGLDSLIEIMTLNGVESLQVSSSQTLNVTENLITNSRVVKFFEVNGYPVTAPEDYDVNQRAFSNSFSNSFK